jgi:hypothetical protein
MPTVGSGAVKRRKTAPGMRSVRERSSMMKLTPAPSATARTSRSSSGSVRVTAGARPSP